MYLHRERIEKAPDLKLAITAGIGSDHVDLHAAQDHGMTVAECTGLPWLDGALHCSRCITGCFSPARVDQGAGDRCRQRLARC